MRGFTLVELLVAIAIFAIMALVAYRGLAGILQAREQVVAESREWREVALFMARLEGDFATVIKRPLRDSGDLVAPAFMGRESAGGADEAQVEFTRTGLPAQTGKLADLQRFGYRLRGNDIEQVVWPVLDRAPRSRPEAFAVLQGVAGFRLRYLDDGGAWQSAWPLPEQTGLPRAVEAAVRLKSGEQVTRVFAL